ncbi:MAG: ECF transporter S component [Massiliimalia sp.]
MSNQNQSQMQAVSHAAHTQKLVLLAVLSAIAYLCVFVFRIPLVSFLKYEPKDVVITIGGFLFGPLSSFIMSLVVSLIEMVTISDTGPIGLLMNVLSTAAFSVTAAAIYKKKRSFSGAVIGLLVGTILMTVLMILWNYLITPYYLLTPRETVKAMLVPVFLPFNLIKGGLNMALTLFLYKPFSNILKKAHLTPLHTEGEHSHPSRQWIPLLLAAIILVISIVSALMLGGVLSF